MKTSRWLSLVMIAVFALLATAVDASQIADRLVVTPIDGLTVRQGAPAGSGAIGKSETGLYIVRFADPALASYTGGVAGLAATSPQTTGARRLDVNSPAS